MIPIDEEEIDRKILELVEETWIKLTTRRCATLVGSNERHTYPACRCWTAERAWRTVNLGRIFVQAIVCANNDVSA
jgi:hypothetical protein